MGIDAKQICGKDIFSVNPQHKGRVGEILGKFILERLWKSLIWEYCEIKPTIFEKRDSVSLSFKFLMVHFFNKAENKQFSWGVIKMMVT